MSWPAACLAALLLVFAASASGGEVLSVCYNYSCLSQDEVLYSDAQLRRVQDLLGDGFSAVHERALLGIAVGWMLGWAVVMGHPYYSATDAKGAFKLENVPPGKHTVEVWHETLGKVTKEVEVKQGGETKVTFEMKK